MKIIVPFAFAISMAQPVLAGVDEALDQHILPSLAAFSAAAEDLGNEAQADCRPEAVVPAFHTAFDAWMAIADVRIGPSETGALSIAFWPDTRGFTQRTLSQFISKQDPVAFDLDDYGEVSIAARGFFALEMLLFDPGLSNYAPASYTCALVQAIASDLDQQAKALDAAWRDDFGTTLRTAGAAKNTTYLDNTEVVRALYTQILSALEFTADQRLGRPMGTFEQPRPTRAEAWRSGRSLRNVLLSVDAARNLAHMLADHDLPETDAAAARVRDLAGRVADHGFQGVTDPQERLHVEMVQQAVRALRAAVEAEVGAPLGITPGFNSQDGD